VPAAAVIPAPEVYTIVAAVKMLVVDVRVWSWRVAPAGSQSGCAPPRQARVVPSGSSPLMGLGLQGWGGLLGPFNPFQMSLCSPTAVS